MSKKWRVFICVFLSGICIAMNQFKLIPISQEIMEEMSLNRTQMGMLTTVFSVAEAVVILPAAVIFCRLRERKTTLLALACALAGTVLGGLSTKFQVLLASRILEGIGVALIAVVLPTLPVRYFAEGEQGKPMGLQAGYISLSVLLIFNVAVPLERLFHTMKSIWFFAGATHLILFLCVYFFVEDSDHLETEMPRYDSVAKNGTVWLLAICFLGIGFRDLSYTNWNADFFKEVRCLPDAVSNLASSMSYAGLWLGSLLSGFLFDLGVKSERLITFSGGCLLILGIWCFTIPNGLVIPFMLATGFVMGLGVSCIYLKAAMCSATKSEATVAVAIANLFLYIGYFLAPVISGAVIDSKGWSADTYVIEAGSAIIFLCGFLMIRQEIQKARSL